MTAPESPTLSPMRWEDGALLLLDQRLLPHQEVWLRLTSAAEVAEAIREMAVRGAPAIGIAAAYGVALDGGTPEGIALLRASRPTAVNLFWALDRMARVVMPTGSTLLAEARAIEAEDLAMNREIGRHGAEAIPGTGLEILTICNTGAIATAGWGTALGIIRSLHEQERLKKVWALETRPRGQGLRLTAYELMKEGIPFAVLADSAAATVLATGRIAAIVAGADRVAANGDAANKIGTFQLGILGKEFSVPLFIAAPTSTIDPATPDGAGIPIEERDARELTHHGEEAVAPVGTPVYNPAFDVTPARYIAGIVTERGVHRPPYGFAT